MKRFVSLTLAVLALAVAVSAQTFSSDGFRIAFPKDPTFNKRDVPTDLGKYELRSYVDDEGSTAFFVGVCDYGAAVNGKDRNTLLQGAEDGALKNSNAHLLSSRWISLQGNPGMAFEAESDAAHFSARIYFVGSTLYQTLVVSPKENVSPSDAFLGSFVLIPRSQ